VNQTETYIREEFIRDGFALWLLTRDKLTGEMTHSAAPVQMVPIERDDSVAFEAEPVAYLSRGAAQLLMNQLWVLGVRPKDAGDPPGALKATERHLEDMRRLVFDARRANGE
jgi:hypothetical protein